MNGEIREIIQTLRPYATEVPKDSPPELLPWEIDDRWGLDGAAGQAVAMLVDGVTASKETFGVADYLHVYNTEGYNGKFGARDRASDGLMLNGTALALFGYLFADDHPEAEWWRVEGCARLVSVAHARKAVLENQITADCVQVVCRVAECLDAPILADLITLQERMWGRLIDHGRAERLQVSAEDYPSHMIEPVSVDEVGNLLRQRPWQNSMSTPDFLMQADVADADGLCDNVMTFRAHMLVRHQFGKRSIGICGCSMMSNRR